MCGDSRQGYAAFSPPHFSAPPPLFFLGGGGGGVFQNTYAGQMQVYSVSQIPYASVMLTMYTDFIGKTARSAAPRSAQRAAHAVQYSAVPCSAQCVLSMHRILHLPYA